MITSALPLTHTDVRQPAAAGDVQLRDQPALGAQGDAVGRVLDVAAR